MATDPPPRTGPIPRAPMDRIDSEIHHLEARLLEDHEQLGKFDQRVRDLELTVGHIDRTLKFWMPVLGALITAALTAVLGQYVK